MTLCFDPVLNDLRYPDGTSRRNYAPPFTGAQLTNLDYVICSHNHADHINMETLKPLHHANPDARFIVPAPETETLTKGGIASKAVMGARQKVSLELAEKVWLHPVAAAHETYVEDEHGDQKNLGYILELDGIRFYHAGDTLVTEKLISDVKEKGPIHMTFLPVNGVDSERHRRGILGNMDCRDGAFFAEQIDADMVFPMHCDMVKKNEENPLFFAHYMQCLYPGRKYHIMQLGERVIYMK